MTSEDKWFPVSKQFFRHLHDSTLYRWWRDKNPGEAERFDAFCENRQLVPDMKTPLGRALVLAVLQMKTKKNPDRP